MLINEIEVHRPQDLPTAVKLLNRENCKILAGGTDLLQDKKFKNTTSLVDISGLKELNFIKKTDSHVEIGALTSFKDIEESEIIKNYVAGLNMAAREFGSPQIRSRATIGGNLGNNSPAADSVPVLMAHEARIKIIKPDLTEKTLDIADYCRNTEMKCLIKSLEIPHSPEKKLSYFDKLGTKKSVTIARLNLACLVLFHDGKKIDKCRIFLGALGKTPVRAREAEKIFCQSGLNDFSQAKIELQKALKKLVDSSIPGRYSQPYKRSAVQGLGQDLLQAMKERLEL